MPQVKFDVMLMATCISISNSYINGNMVVLLNSEIIIKRMGHKSVSYQFFNLFQVSN